MTNPAAAPDPPPLGQPERDPRPVVALPRQGLPGAVIAGIAGLLALILFLVLDAQRRRAAVSPRPETTQGTFAPPPPLAIPREPEAVPEIPRATIVTSTLPPSPVPRAQPVPPVALLPSTPVIVPAPPAVPATEPEPAARRLSEPALVIDTGEDGSTVLAAPATPGGARGRAAAIAGGGSEAPVRATVIRDRTNIMAIGTLIPAVLETPIDTARPGLVRAVVSRDTRGFDGKRVLVPRGARLIGEYQSDVRSGQNRVLVTWTRLIRPDGATIQLGSPAADQLGGAGVPGRLNTFFLQRFASAVLQSALTIGVNLASRPRAGSVVVGIPSGPITTVGQGLLPGNDLRPKITVKQGAALNVFVARDLDFSGTGNRAQ